MALVVLPVRPGHARLPTLIYHQHLRICASSPHWLCLCAAASANSIYLTRCTAVPVTLDLVERGRAARRRPLDNETNRAPAHRGRSYAKALRITGAPQSAVNGLSLALADHLAIRVKIAAETVIVPVGHRIAV